MSVLITLLEMGGAPKQLAVGAVALAVLAWVCWPARSSERSNPEEKQKPRPNPDHAP